MKTAFSVRIFPILRSRESGVDSLFAMYIFRQAFQMPRKSTSEKYRLATSDQRWEDEKINATSDQIAEVGFFFCDVVIL